MSPALTISAYAAPMMILRALAPLALLLSAGSAAADPAEVVEVGLRPDGAVWRVDVTIRHPDTGWDDYADGWRVELADGTVLGTRILAHPHVEEQPFTRTLGDVTLPDDLGAVFIRTSTNVTGWADAADGPFPVPAE